MESLNISELISTMFKSRDSWGLLEQGGATLLFTQVRERVSTVSHLTFITRTV